MLSPLKDARLHHDPPLRLIDVAQRAGVSVSLVSMVESGYACSTSRGVASREAIAQAVGASYGSFWGER